MAGPKISLIVPTLNRREPLRRLLESVDGLSGLVPDEVIIVDGGSTDGSVEFLEAWASKAHAYSSRIVRQQRGVGPGHARNLGIKASSGEILAFTDDDCVVQPLWLANLVSGFDGDHAVVGVGGRVRALRDDIFSQYYVFHKILEPPSSLLYLVSANCCYGRDAVLAAGGFDEGLLRPGGEDVGLSLKLLHGGGRLRISEGAIVYHEFRSGLVDFCRTFFNYGSGCGIIAARHLLQGVQPEFPYHSQFNGPDPFRGYGALSPPGLTPVEIWRDSLNAFRQYHSVRIGAFTACRFLALRTVQRFAYSAGWRSTTQESPPQS